MEHQEKIPGGEEPRRNVKSKQNLIAFLHLEQMASKVIVIGEENYFLLEALDSLEFFEISHS